MHDTPCTVNLRLSIKIRVFSFYESEAATIVVLQEKVFLEISQNSHESSCPRVSFLKKLQALDLQLYLKKTLVQVFSCEFGEHSENTFLTEHLWEAASDESPN